MITASRAPRKTGRIFRIALAGSLLVHVLAALLIFGSSDALRRFFPEPAPPPAETVAISTALHLEKRVHPVPSHPSRPREAVAANPRHTVAHPVPPVAMAAPQRANLQRQDRSKPLSARHELSRLEPHATPVPRMKSPPTIEPRPAKLPPAEPKRIAFAPLSSEAQSRRRAAHVAHYSQAQIAAIDRDLAQGIAHDRSADNPLSNVRRAVTPATNVRQQAIDFSGITGRRNGFEGVCEPIKSWPSGTYVYFYLTCRVAHEDGLVREEALPWPVRYPARRLAYDADGPLLPSGGPVAPPLPGWRPDPSQKLDPDVILYLRKYGYPI